MLYLPQYDTNVETIVTMEVNSRGISVTNAADKTLAFYNILSLRYCGMWPKDKRLVFIETRALQLLWNLS